MKRAKDGGGSKAQTRAAQPSVVQVRGGFSRRDFLAGAGGIAALGSTGEAAAAAEAAAVPTVRTLAGDVTLTLTINGEARAVNCEARTTLLHALRVFLEPPLTGTKDVCDRGNCGACTVLLDDQPACACLVLAADCEGRAITTVEGLGTPEQLSPLQASFCEKDALMCGFCTPGFVMAIEAQLRRDPSSSIDAIKSACSGNICRCGTYTHVFEAAKATVEELRGGGR